MNVNDAIYVFHRNNGMPVSDDRGKPIALPAPGQPMRGTVVALRNGSVDIKGIDAAGEEFDELAVVVLEPGAMLPRGGRYALRVDDDSVHPPYSGPM